MFSEGFVILFTGGGGLPERDQPGKRPPLDRDPPLTVTPLDRDQLDRDPPLTETSPGQRPPGQKPLDRDPLDRDLTTVKSGRYASYWNAFLY